MASYKVATDRIAGKSAGDTVTDEELPGVNVEALVAAGHLTANKPPKEDKPKADKEN